MFCPQCGKPVLGGARFCSHCGAGISAVVAAAGPEPGTPSPAPAAPRPEPLSGGSPASGAAPGANHGSDVPPTADTASGLIARVKNILISPSTEWPVVAAERSAVSDIYLGYVAPLVAIGVIATFLGHSMIGLPLLGAVGVGAGLAHAIISFALSFLGVLLIAWIVDLLAPTFGGQRDSLAALKVTAYSFTPGWVAGVLNLIPMLGILAIIAALYGLYLLYLGLPMLMRCPRDKSVGYTVVTVLCAIVTGGVIAMLTTCAVAGLSLIGIGAM
jgi:hypothetical protein